MLKIYTSKEKALELSKIKDIVPDIESRFNLVFTDKDSMFRDSTSIEILKEIEGYTKRYENDVIIGKFGAVSISNISEGGKGLLLATTYNDKSIINIDPLGYNCIYLLFKLSTNRDIEAISTRILYHMKKDFKAMVNNKLCSGINISIEMEKYNE